MTRALLLALALAAVGCNPAQRLPDGCDAACARLAALGCYHEQQCLSDCSAAVDAHRYGGGEWAGPACLARAQSCEEAERCE